MAVPHVIELQITYNNSISIVYILYIAYASIFYILKLLKISYDLRQLEKAELSYDKVKFRGGLVLPFFSNLINGSLWASNLNIKYKWTATQNQTHQANTKRHIMRFYCSTRNEY